MVRPRIDEHVSEIRERRLTRRTLGGMLLGGLTSAGIGSSGAARGEPALTAEPDGPDHLPRRRIKAQRPDPVDSAQFRRRGRARRRYQAGVSRR